MVEPISDPMLIAYDGPNEARWALIYAGKLLRAKKVYTLTAELLLISWTEKSATD